jgi:hypothetical protein
MHPRQKLRLMSLVAFITGLPALFYLKATEHPLNLRHVWFVFIYMFAILLGGVIYMLRHRDELRDPPEVREQQRQWAVKNGPALLNLFIVLFLAEAIWLAFQLHGGHLDQRLTMLFRVKLIASLPALVLLAWVKIRMRTRGRQDSG